LHPRGNKYSQEKSFNAGRFAIADLPITASFSLFRSGITVAVLTTYRRKPVSTSVSRCAFPEP
jgi:hypothetical protein